MEPFCTSEQYVARFGAVADSSALAECLADASAVIRARLDEAGIDYSEPDEDFADRLMRVCRSMASRIMPSATPEASIPVGATQMNMTAGPYSRQFTMPGGYGTPKLLQGELDLLGIARARGGAGWAQMGGRDV